MNPVNYLRDTTDVSSLRLTLYNELRNELSNQAFWDITENDIISLKGRLESV